MKSLLIFLFIIFGMLVVKGRDTTKIITENGWIEKMNNQIGLKLSLDNMHETFRVSTPENKINLYPNITTIGSIGIYYRFLRASIGFTPDFLPGNGDDNTKGKTKSFSFSVAAYLRHWYQSFGFTSVQGFYLKNSDDYIPWSPGDPYIQFPELYFTGYSGTTGYYFNPKLSLKSLSIQTERQLKSAGSFFMQLNYRYYIIDDRSTPSPGGATQKSDNFEVCLSPGYIYNYVFQERFYASLAAMPGLGFINTDLKTRFATGDIKSHQHNWAFRWAIRSGIGYNGHKYYAGLYLTSSGMEFKQQNTTAVNYNTRVFYQFFVGLRINAPGGMNKFFNSLNEMLTK